MSKRAGVAGPARHYGLGVVWGDYDNDGWPDLYVANDSGPNYLYRNNHDGTFDENAMLAGVALGPEGQELGSMGVDMADFDRDGKLDIVVTNYSNQPKDLYWNQGLRGFNDLTYSSKISKSAHTYVGWGTGFADFDNKGLPDILMANGHAYPEVDTVMNEPPYRQPMLLFYNKGDRTFEETATAAGLNAGPLQSRRGVAFGDINNDGQINFVVFNVGAPPSLFINETRNTNHRVLLKLVGTKSNREAVGARATMHTGARAQMEEVKAGNSYISTSDPRLHFGLGADTMIDRLEIRWPSGATEILKNVPADAVYTITEGQGITGTIKLAVPTS